MSGPYNPLYLLPPLRIPAEPDPSGRGAPAIRVSDWLDDRYALLNADMRNAWTGAQCTSDNASVVTFTLLDRDLIRAQPGLDRVSWQMLFWSDLKDEANYRDHIVTGEGGVTTFELSPSLAPDAWCEPSILAETATECANRLKAQDAGLMEIMRNVVEQWGRDLDYAEFLPPDRQSEVGMLFSDEADEVDDEFVATVGASAFATIAWHARSLADQGAPKVILLEVEWGTEIGIPGQESPGTAPERKGWLSRLFGGD